MNLPDLVSICVSSPRQAEAIAAAITRRVDRGVYPRELEFAVVHDPEAGRVGSGGGTINALAQLRERYGDAVDAKSILLIHAGGESRRLPAYAPENKLFAPVPVPSSTLLPPVLLDIQLDLYFRYPWRDGELVVASGDVYLDFDCGSVRSDRGAICGFAAPASLEEGSRHGVFVFDRHGREVNDYLQKAPVDQLARHGTLPGGQSCALDIGIVAFCGDGRDRLRAAEVKLGPDIAAGRMNIDLYVELLTATLPEISGGVYSDRVTPLSRLTRAEQERVYSLFGGVGVNGILVRESTFLHFGSVREIAESAASLAASSDVVPFYDVARGAGLRPELGPEIRGAAVVANTDDVEIETERFARTYIEGSSRTRLRLAGENLVTGVHGRDLSRWSIPAGFCLDGRTVPAEAGEAMVEVVAVYHAGDTFKPAESVDHVCYCGRPLSEWLAMRGLEPHDLGIGNKPVDLWSLPLFAEDADDHRLMGYIHDSLVDTAWTEWFRSARRRDLRQLTDASDVGGA